MYWLLYKPWQWSHGRSDSTLAKRIYDLLGVRSTVKMLRWMCNLLVWVLKEMLTRFYAARFYASSRRGPWRVKSLTWACRCVLLLDTRVHPVTLLEEVLTWANLLPGVTSDRPLVERRCPLDGARSNSANNNHHLLCSLWCANQE